MSGTQYFARFAFGSPALHCECPLDILVSSQPLLAPLETHLASPNHVLVKGSCAALTPTPSAFLRCDFALRSESIGCSVRSLPALASPDRAGPSRVASQSHIINQLDVLCPRHLKKKQIAALANFKNLIECSLFCRMVKYFI